MKYHIVPAISPHPPGQDICGNNIVKATTTVIPYLEQIQKLYFHFTYTLYRHAYNIDIHDLHGMVVKAVIELPMKDHPDQEGIQLVTNIKAVSVNPVQQDYLVVQFQKFVT